MEREPFVVLKDHALWVVEEGPKESTDDPAKFL
jgi:hypothetical protein